MSSFILFLGLVWSMYLMQSNSCPVNCRCVTSSAHSSADCSYQELDSVPRDLTSNLSQISLSANYISALNVTSFAATTEVMSLWLGYNKITTIEPGTFRVLLKLISLDLSNNLLMDFPWSDLSALHHLQILNLNNNHLVTLPPGTFNRSKNLRSLQLSNNRFSSLPEGIFDPLTSMSHLQLYNNPFNCSCPLFWLKDWMQKSKATVDRISDIVCSSPHELLGVSLLKLPDMQCRKPLEIQGDDPLIGKMMLLCMESGDHNVMSSNLNKIKVTIKFLGNGSIMVTPIKHDIVYHCHVPKSNQTSTKNDFTSSQSYYEVTGQLKDKDGKLLLIVVSERGKSEVNLGSHALAWSMLCCLVLLWG